MIKRVLKSDSKSDSSKRKIINRMNKISYDEHFTRATESVDLARNARFVDIDDGISRRRMSEIEKYTR